MKSFIAKISLDILFEKTLRAIIIQGKEGRSLRVGGRPWGGSWRKKIRRAGGRKEKEGVL